MLFNHGLYSYSENTYAEKKIISSTTLCRILRYQSCFQHKLLSLLEQPAVNLCGSNFHRQLQSQYAALFNFDRDQVIFGFFAIFLVIQLSVFLVTSCFMSQILIHAFQFLPLRFFFASPFRPVLPFILSYFFFYHKISIL